MKSAEELRKDLMGALFPRIPSEAPAELDDALICVQEGACLAPEGPDSRLSPLAAAAWRGDARLITAMLERGAIVDQRMKDGWTPLMYACREGNAVTAEVLVEQGADIHAASRDGFTCYSLAESNGHGPVQKILIEAQRAKEKQEADARFAAEVASMHVAQRPVAVGHALRFRRGM
jgi:ankyrin repeat protein